MTQPLPKALQRHLADLRADLEASGYTPEEIEPTVAAAEAHMRAYRAANPRANETEVIADLVGPKGGAGRIFVFLVAAALAFVVVVGFGILTGLFGSD